MTSIARYAVTYMGNGIIRLPRAGIFQTGTRAVVDEVVARIAMAHGSFQVVALTHDAPALVEPAAAEAPAPAPMPVAVVAAEKRPHGRRTQRHSAVIAVPGGDSRGR